jgi:hypothetical protein
MTITHAEMAMTKPGNCTTCGSYAKVRNTAGQCTACHNAAYFRSRAQRKQELAQRHAQLAAAGQQAMAEVGAKVGQRVSYSVLGWAMVAETYTGTITLRRGIPYVRLDTPANGRRYVRWHKGWIPSSIVAE